VVSVGDSGCKSLLLLCLPSSHEHVRGGERGRGRGGGRQPAEDTGAGGEPAEAQHRGAAEGHLGPLRAGHGRELCHAVTPPPAPPTHTLHLPPPFFSSTPASKREPRFPQPILFIIIIVVIKTWA